METNEAMEAEKAAKGHKAEAEQILNGILSDIAGLEAKVGALYELRGRVRNSYITAGGNPREICLMSAALGNKCSRLALVGLFTPARPVGVFFGIFQA